MTKINWPGLDKTINPIIGCNRISAGCDHCYAERMARRLAKTPYMQERYSSVVTNGYWNGKTRFVESELEKPFRRKKPTCYFAVSMGDLFHDSVPFDWQVQLFAMMALTPRHQYMLLTKRADKMLEVCNLLVFTDNLEEEMSRVAFDRGLNGTDWKQHENPMPLPNVSLGVTCEDQEQADKRIPLLLQCPAAWRFLSLEPLLSGVDLGKYIRYNVMYENITPRRNRLREGCPRAAGNRSGRHNMEGCGDSRQQVEQRDKAEGSETPSSGNRQRAISPSMSDSGCEANNVPGAPASMATFPRTDSQGIGDQPQERDQEGQSSCKPGGGDTLGECKARLPHGAEKRKRREKPELPLAEYGNQGHTDSLCEDNDNASKACKNVRRISTDDIRHSTRGQQENARRTNCGLCTKASIEKGGAKQPGPISLCIVGAETGPGARWMDPEWAYDIRDQCEATGVPFFVKRMSNGEPVPDDLMIREHCQYREPVAG